MAEGRTPCHHGRTPSLRGGLERTTKAVAKEQSELEIGRRRLDAGRMVGNVINQQQGLGDALMQIATPQRVLHNAPRPDAAPVVVTPPPPP